MSPGSATALRAFARCVQLLACDDPGASHSGWAVGGTDRDASRRWERRMQPRDTSCLFCAIAAGHVPCHAVYEDEHLLAFSGPSALESGVRPGRAQTPRAGLSPLGLRAVWRAHAARLLSGAMPGTLYQPPKVGLFGIGFHVPHVHVHVVPLYAMADMTAEAFERAQRTSPAVAVLVDSAAQIRHALAVMEDDDTPASGWHA